MSMKEWARNEIDIACNLKRDNEDSGDFDYSLACYESAYKAFVSLLEDNHSGFSIGVTKSILNRLIDGKPLTPIVDAPNVWHEVDFGRNGYTAYQCNRMSALFKYVYNDGTVPFVKYSDIDRVYCVDEDNLNAPGWHNGFVRKIIDELYPIGMPYFPSKNPIVVHCREGLSDPKNGDYDSLGILYAIEPDGSRNEINRFFKEHNNEWNEIDKTEFDSRICNKIMQEAEVKDKINIGVDLANGPDMTGSVKDKSY